MCASLRKEKPMDGTLEMTRGILESTPQRWANLVETVPDELLRRPASLGEWSAVDCLRHLFESDRNLLMVRLHHILEGRAELTPYDADDAPEPGAEKSTQEILDAFVSLRRQTVQELDVLTSDDLNRSSFHPEYGVNITLGQLLSHWAAHDLLHIVQAEEALMQAFIPNTTV
jgi:uncharacterized damage-inducible protein DinB